MQAGSGLYELFVLGKLMHRPMHGYLLHSIMNAAVGPFRRLSWGTLYPLLRRLEQAGFIAPEADGSSDGRGIRNFRTTSHGRERFYELMRSEHYDRGDFRDLFRVRLSNFGHIDGDDRRAILHTYRDFLAEIVRHSESVAGEVAEARGLASAERPFVLAAIDHQRHLSVSEIAWLDALLQTTGGQDESTVDRKSYSASNSDGHGRSRADRPRRRPARK